MELETPASIIVLDVVTKLSPANGAFWRGNCSAFSGAEETRWLSGNRASSIIYPLSEPDSMRSFRSYRSANPEGIWL
jgi:hypothetical protein